MVMKDDCCNRIKSKFQVELVLIYDKWEITTTIIDHGRYFKDAFLSLTLL